MTENIGHLGNKARVIRSSCKGCHECVDVCPSEAISFPEGGAVIDTGRCTGCGVCRTVCRFDAIMLRRFDSVLAHRKR